LFQDVSGGRGGLPAETLVEHVAKRAKKIDKAGLSAALNDQSSGRRFVEQTLVNSPKGVASDEMYTLMLSAGGKEGKIGAGIRASLIDNYLNSVISFSKGEVSRNQPVVSGGKVSALWNDWEQRGLTKFFTPEDRQFLTDWNSVARVADSWSRDVGASMQAGTIASDLWTMDDVPQGFWNVAKAYGIGWLLTTKATNRFLTGGGKAPAFATGVGELMMHASDNPVPVLTSLARAVEDRSGVGSKHNWNEELQKKYRGAEPASVVP
jgi:hypothetical protein